MNVTGNIRIKSAVNLWTAQVRFDMTWEGGPLARLTKELLKPVNAEAVGRIGEIIQLPSYVFASRTGRSTVLLLQTRLRVIAEREHYLVVMRDGWQARAVQLYHRALEILTERCPALFGWLKSQLV